MHILLAQFYSSQTTPEYNKIAAGLRERGHRVWLATPNRSGDLEWHDGQRIVAAQPLIAETAAGSTKGSAGRFRIKLDYFRRIRDFIRDTRPDIVQINAGGFFRFMPLLMPASTHFVLDVRQIGERHGRGLASGTKSLLYNKSRALYSRFIFDRTCFLHWAGARHVIGDKWERWATVVPMGVDQQFLTAGRNLTYIAAERPKVRFIYVGRLAKRRQLELIIQAAANVREKTDRFQVNFVGFDMSEGFYQRWIDELKLQDVVTIKPPIPYETVPGVILEHDVALAVVPAEPADWMYHPTLKILEYRALGIPTIATDFLPNREMVQDGVNGILVENDVDEIAQAMLRFIEDRAFLQQSRDNAVAMRTGLTWNEAAAMYEKEVYEPLLAGMTGKLGQLTA